MFGKNKNAISEESTRAKIGTVIGEGTVFDGDFTAPEAIRMDGIINGNCTCKKQLILGPQGNIKGNISAASVIISGTVSGNITVSGRLELLSTGKIDGDIIASSLVIDEGAYFDGRCTMANSVEKIPTLTAADKPETKTPALTAADNPEVKTEKKVESSL